MNITIGRYPVPTDQDRLQVGPAVHFPADRWESWVEPEDKGWILFVGTDGTSAFWPERDEDGGVVGEAVISRGTVRNP